MTVDIDNDGTTLHESGGVVQPTDAQIEALRLADELERDKWHVSAVTMQRAADCLRALAVPQAPLQAEPVPVVASERGESVTLAERINGFVDLCGSLRAAADVLDVDAGYLSRLRSGEKEAPSDDLLKRLGLTRVVTYERVNKKWAATPLTPRTKTA